MLTSRFTRALATRLVALLPEFPRPWDLQALCRDLANARGRRLTLHPVDLPALPSGLWYDDGTADRIIYRASATGYHRDHIVLHEVCHILAGHGTPLPATGNDLGVALAASRAGARGCHGAEEELAEAFASMVLKMAGQLPPRGVTPVERRAVELFGADCA